MAGIGTSIDQELKTRLENACKQNNTTIYKILQKFVKNYIAESEAKKLPEEIK